jgi:hypothetical protein
MHVVDLELGRCSVTTNVTTDHPCRDETVRRAGLPPLDPPADRRTRGGGDGHLPGRLEILAGQALATAWGLLIGVAIVGVLEGRRHG